MVTIRCDICSAEIIFNPDDPTSYIQKNITSNKLLGDLFTYRVKHSPDNYIRHINVVVLDENNEYRAHKDSYEEAMELLSDDAIWQEFLLMIPLEIKHYFNIIDQTNKDLIQDEFLKDNMQPNEWLIYFQSLVEKYPQNQFFRFVHTKWSHIMGQPVDFSEYTPGPSDWNFPLYLRYKVKEKADLSYLDLLDQYDHSANIYLETEYAMARAEIALRCSNYDLTIEIFNQFSERWENESSFPFKISYNVIKAYYGFAKNLQGKLNTALEILELVFNLAQITGSRDLTVISGIFYGRLLKNDSRLDEAESVYAIILEIINEFDDQRNQFIIRDHLAGVYAFRGKLNEALELYQENNRSPLIEKDQMLKLAVSINLADILVRLDRNIEALNLLTPIFEMELTTQAAISLYELYLETTRNIGLMQHYNFLQNQIDEKHITEDDRGKTFRIDLLTTKALLENDWDTVIDTLQQQLEIVRTNEYSETISILEMRLAEAYYNRYEISKSTSDINNCYKHLDLVRAIASEGGYWVALYEVTKLKAMVVLSIGHSERVDSLLHQAKEIVQKQNLKSVEAEINHLLEKIGSEEMRPKREELFRRFHLQPIASGDKRKIRTDVVMIHSNDQSWNLNLAGDLEGREGLIDYLKGIRTMWRYARDFIENRGVTTIRDQSSSDLGTLVIEQGNEYFIVALCKQESYKLRSDLREIVYRLENFELRHITEEREAFVRLQVKTMLDVENTINFDN